MVLLEVKYSLFEVNYSHVNYCIFNCIWVIFDNKFTQKLWLINNDFRTTEGKTLALKLRTTEGPSNNREARTREVILYVHCPMTEVNYLLHLQSLSCFPNPAPTSFCGGQGMQ